MGATLYRLWKTTGPGYDSLHTRRFQFVPLFGLPVYFLYAMRRVNCSWRGKVKVERVPWADGKRPVTRACSRTLAGWAQRVSWQVTAKPCGVS